MVVHPVTDELLAAIGQTLPGVELDDWAPSVQGAVGRVVGLTGSDGARYVLKTYDSSGQRRAATEVRALDLLRDVAGVPVPGVVAHDVASTAAASYVLMTRLPGARWADRRSRLTPAQGATATKQVGRALRRFHALPGRWFGDLLGGGSMARTSWDRTSGRCDDLLRTYLAAGGPAGLARRVRRFVDDHRQELAFCSDPVLCHNDFIDGNLLVHEAGEPNLCGVVDLERASWDDPLNDLAQTRLHVRYHDAAGPPALVAAYGVEDEDELSRLDVYELLHTLEERTWIIGDRPYGWQRSVEALDTFLAERTRKGATREP